MSKPGLPQTAPGVLRPHPGVLRPHPGDQRPHPGDRRPHPGFWDHRQRLCTVETLYLFLSLKCLSRGRVRNIGAEIPWRWSLPECFYVVSGFFYFHPQCKGRRHLRLYVICEPRGAHPLMLRSREINLSFFRRLRGSNPDRWREWRAC